MEQLARDKRPRRTTNNAEFQSEIVSTRRLNVMSRLKVMNRLALMSRLALTLRLKLKQKFKWEQRRRELQPLHLIENSGRSRET